MNPQDQDTDQIAADNPLHVQQPGERTICEIKRHPIGILGIYVAAGFMLVVLAVIAFVLVPNAAGDGSQATAQAAGAVAFVVLALMSLVFVFISNKVYWDNRLILTSDSITEVVRSSLFDRQSSQLSLGNLEDITAEQNGPLAHMFGYGTLRVETAGERSHFVYPYCPRPNYYAQQILAAREAFEQGHRGGKKYPEQAEPPQAAIDSYEVPS